MRATAWGVVAIGAAAPLVRKRVKAPPVVVQAVAYAAPVGLCVAVRRSRMRDAAVCALQMWAYVAAYKFPHDDPDAQRRRVRVEYPIVIDRALGLGQLPTLRLQRALSRSGPDGPRWRAVDRVLVWAHWSWFMVPHGSIVYILVRHPARFPRAAVLMYATFNIGASAYWLVPTAPPWWVADAGERELRQVPVARRMMVEYGEDFWKDSASRSCTWGSTTSWISSGGPRSRSQCAAGGRGRAR
jgi:hypothetical protein